MANRESDTTALVSPLRQSGSKAVVKALVLSCTLKHSPETSNTEALAQILTSALEREQVETELVRVVDHAVSPGVSSDEGDGDEWPAIRAKIVSSEILIVASPTWLGKPSSVAFKVLERMDALLSEEDDQGRPIAYNRVAGVVVTGNEDGAHHVISEISGALSDIGFTIPGQAFTYWNMGPGPGPDYLESDHKRDWSRETGEMAAANLLAVARALAGAPISGEPLSSGA